MLLTISTKLGLATLDELALIVTKTSRVAGVEVNEYAELTHAQAVADARDLLSTDYAQSREIVLADRRAA